MRLPRKPFKSNIFPVIKDLLYLRKYAREYVCTVDLVLRFVYERICENKLFYLSCFSICLLFFIFV